MEPALKYYEQAGEKRPDNAKVLLCLARVNHELENYGTVRKYYDKLKVVSPSIATQFQYLDFRGSEASRAADIAQIKGVVLWDEEE